MYFMKKILIALAIASLGTVANAQTTQLETPSKYSVATNSFWSNWYVQLGVDTHVQVPYGTGSFFNDNWHNGRTYGLDAAIGKWFTPGIGTRLKLNWENGAFAHAFRNTDHVPYAPDFHKGGYAGLYFDTQFNLSNLICGYSDTRVWNLVAYPRLGVIRRFDEDSYSMTIGFGIESLWKLSDRVSLYLDGSYNRLDEHYMSIENTVDKSSNASNGIIALDFGVQINLGKTGWSKAVTLEAYNALAAASEEALAKLRAELDKERAENARLRAQLQELKSAPAKVEKVISSAATSVFFDLNSTVINSKKDLVNLEAVAAAAKESGAKVIVTGSADSKTGSSAWNQKLSEGRANAVADELVNLGVNRDNITVNAIGGVDQVAPYTLNRRAVVELK